MDRSITLTLRRKLPEETAERLRHAKLELFKILTAKLARFSLDSSSQIKNNRSTLPNELNDRAQDNWDPLISIAEVGG